ncbi:pyrroline-5-carboxylate reductase [bacterium]|nr:pyrroline-5-carboxylate reductase [bacterium]
MNANAFKNKTVGFVGFGKMGQALWRGFSALGLQANVYDPHPVSDIHPEVRWMDAEGVWTQSDWVWLCIKPQTFLGQTWPKSKRPVISIMAGIPLATLTQYFDVAIRVMPNTPVAIGQGVSAIAYPEPCDPVLVEQVTRLLAACGHTVAVKEEWMDAITALSGSGPAFFYELVRVSTEWAALRGIPQSVALTLLSSTLMGAGSMLQHTPDPGQLIAQVVSPNGTTQAGLSTFAHEDIPSKWAHVLTATETRSKELR